MKKINLCLEREDLECFMRWWNANVVQSGDDEGLQIYSIPVLSKEDNGYTCCCMHGCPYADEIITTEEIILCSKSGYTASDYTINGEDITCYKLYLAIKHWHETDHLVNGKKFEEFIEDCIV